MDPNALFTVALCLTPPWEVRDLRFSVEAKRLDIVVDFEKGASFPCPVCGAPSKAHDTEERTWRHLDFLTRARGPSPLRGRHAAHAVLFRCAEWSSMRPISRLVFPVALARSMG